jgi:serine/threonine protein kinase
VVEPPLGLSLVNQAFGPYRAERLSFATGLSTFVFARHADTRERVVVKVFDAKPGPRATADGAAVWRARFEREARLCSRLRSDHVVRARLVGETAGGHPFIVFSRFPATLIDEIGADPNIASGLQRRGKTARPLPVGRTVKVLRDILTGLAALHEQGIVHRDIKPPNILLTRRHGGLAVIGDLGLARVPGEPDDADGGWVGTPFYLAPEQSKDADAVDARADVYSVGCLAYRMLAGALPDGGARSAAERAPACPAWLDALIADALSPDPVSRPENAQAFLDTIDWARSRGLR